MTLSLLPLYVASFAMIGLLGGFAHHNKRTGWVKKRRSFFEDLLELQAFSKELEGPVESEPEPVLRMGTAPSVQESAHFSTQLAGMNAGLRSGVKIGSPEVSTEDKAVEPEHVSA